MNVAEALKARRSCRAFLPDPVDRETLLAVLGDALHSPSWANTQPWEIFAAGGKLLREIDQAYLERYRDNVPQSPDLPRPAAWPEGVDQRRRELSSGIALAAGERAKEFGELNRTFFHAPTVIYLCMDKSLTSWSAFDLGALSHGILLSAAERGLATIPAVTLVAYPDILRSKLGIPDRLSVVIGIAIGYEDSQHPINRFRSARRPAAEVVTLRGVD